MVNYDKNIFAGNLRRFAGEQNENQTDIAELLEVSKTTISSYFNAQKMPRMDKIKKLADHFGVSISELTEEFDSSAKPDRAASIPVLRKAPAGIPIEAIEDVLGYEEIPAAMARTGEFFCLRVEGSSMHPLIYSGEIIVVRKQASADQGDIVVALIDNDETTVKRLKKIPDGIILEAENENYSSLFFSNNQIENGKVQIIGKVVESRKKF